MKNLFLLWFTFFYINAFSQQYLFFDKENSGLSSNRIISVKQDSVNNYYIVTEPEYINNVKISSGYLHKFSNGTWSKIDTINSLSLIDIVQDVEIDKNDRVLLATSEGFIVKDGSNSTIFNKDNSSLPDNSIFTIAVDRNNTYYLGIPNYGVWIYSNGLWSYFNYQNSFNGIEDLNFIFIDKQNNIWIGTDYYGLYMYNGTSWEQKINNFYNGKRCFIMGITEDNNGLIYVTVQTQEGKHFIATGDNSNFTFFELINSTHPFSFYAYNSIKADKKNYVYAGTSNGLFNYNKLNWSVFDSTDFNLPGNYFVSGFVDKNNNKIFGVESFNQHKAFGMLFYNEDGVNITSTNLLVYPKFSYSLSQNYPNPFNPITTIIYQIPTDCDISLKIFDVLGKEIKTLVNEYKTAGKYYINFDASNLASGVYFYKLESSEYLTTKKLILVK